MDNETLFYIFGGVAAVSAVVVTFAGLKLKNFPGRMLPLVIVWFAAFAIAASTFSVLQAKDHEAHEAHQQHEAEDAKSGPYENEGGALGGEREELEEEAEQEAEGAPEEEPVGPTEESQESDEGGQQSSPGSEGTGSGAEASTTLDLAADPTAIAFDKTELSAKAGKVTIDFDNPSAIPHNVVILEGEKELAGFEPITEGQESVSADLEAGSYTFICSVPGHPEAGMKGTLTVE